MTALDRTLRHKIGKIRCRVSEEPALDHIQPESDLDRDIVDILDILHERIEPFVLEAGILKRHIVDIIGPVECFFQADRIIRPALV